LQDDDAVPGALSLASADAAGVTDADAGAPVGFAAGGDTATAGVRTTGPVAVAERGGAGRSSRDVGPAADDVDGDVAALCCFT